MAFPGIPGMGGAGVDAGISDHPMQYNANTL
jgi:hypothetical protein